MNKNRLVKLKKVKNLIAINTLIFATLLALFVINDYCDKKIYELINEESNKVIYIYNYNDLDQISNILKNYQKEIVKIEQVDKHNISIKINDYLKLDEMINLLNKEKIDAGKNNAVSDNIETYNKVNKLIKILFFIIIGIILFISLFFTYSILSEERKNIKIYDILGFSYKDIFLQYFNSYSKIILLNYIGVLIISCICALIIDIF